MVLLWLSPNKGEWMTKCQCVGCAPMQLPAAFTQLGKSCARLAYEAQCGQNIRVANAACSQRRHLGTHPHARTNSLKIAGGCPCPPVRGCNGTEAQVLAGLLKGPSRLRNSSPESKWCPIFHNTICWRISMVPQRWPNLPQLLADSHLTTAPQKWPNLPHCGQRSKPCLKRNKGVLGFRV